MNTERFKEIDIVYENDDLLVINKPTGVVVTPGAGYAIDNTLAGWLLQRYGGKIASVGIDGQRPGIVHRLDKDTSGVLLVAKSDRCFESLTYQFSHREIQKRYHAFVWGDVAATVYRKKGREEEIDLNPSITIDAPIGRNPKNRMRWAVVPTGKIAQTRISVHKKHMINDMPITEVYCEPRTGRTHQIRVHCVALGHPIVGDPLYQSRRMRDRYVEAVEGGFVDNRLHLHAQSIKLKTAITAETPLAYEAPTPLTFHKEEETMVGS